MATYGEFSDEFSSEFSTGRRKLVNPQSELIRDPGLLRRGQLPFGKVRVINTSLTRDLALCYVFSQGKGFYVNNISNTPEPIGEKCEIILLVKSISEEPRILKIFIWFFISTVTLWPI